MQCNIYLDNKYSLLCICLLKVSTLAKIVNSNSTYILDNIFWRYPNLKNIILLMLFKENSNTQSFCVVNGAIDETLVLQRK